MFSQRGVDERQQAFRAGSLERLARLRQESGCEDEHEPVDEASARGARAAAAAVA